MSAKLHFKPNEPVSYRASGKISRLEGKDGVIVSGKVVEDRGEDLVVLPDHRKEPNADFFDIPSLVPKTNIVEVE